MRDSGNDRLAGTVSRESKASAAQGARGGWSVVTAVITVTAVTSVIPVIVVTAVSTLLKPLPKPWLAARTPPDSERCALSRSPWPIPPSRMGSSISVLSHGRREAPSFCLGAKRATGAFWPFPFGAKAWGPGSLSAGFPSRLEMAGARLAADKRPRPSPTKGREHGARPDATGIHGRLLWKRRRTSRG